MDELTSTSNRPRSNFWPWLAGGVLCVALGWALFIRHNSSGREPDLIVGAAEVQISRQGFLPGVVRVKRGSSVTWVNQNSGSHQISSGPSVNPPGFDSDAQLGPGESYSFTFDRTGSFPYHDSLNPTQFKGTVVVVD